MLDKIIFYSFGLLFFLVPLFWSPINFELFEFNKMILVYLLTIIITGSWLLKSINQKQLTINRTPLDIPLFLFLGSQILSTIFSIDVHTSIWGYYSRSNGGLLSLIAYLLLYFAFVSNISKNQALKILKMGLFGGLIVSLWGIAEHFGVSPSCVILRGQFNASCWVQDVEARVFASLGQPNWMAAYLAMLIFPALYFALTAKTKQESTIYHLLSIIYYLAFTFTYSRGATLGLIAGMVVFVILHYGRTILTLRASKASREAVLKIMKPFLVVLAIFLFLNLLFGSALTRIQLSQLFSKSQSETTKQLTNSLTQLENGGTESGKIRLIVWQGAIDIFKHYPILGSGVETFGLSYYQFRPVAANLTSEWDFLYNKAHNEFLNYLATTGIVGFGTYLFVIVSFIFWAVKSNLSKPSLLTISLLASYVSYLVQNFFGFSIVIVALFFFLFPSLAFVVTDSTKPYSINHKLYTLFYSHPKIVKSFIVLSIFYLLFSIFKVWYADTIFATGEQYSESGNSLRAYSSLRLASSLRPDEPFYLSELGVAAAGSALGLKETDATLSATLKIQAEMATEYVLKTDPKNTSFWRTAIRTYYDLTQLDKSYNTKLLSTFDTAIKLAPTDPKLRYNKAVVLGTMNRNDEAIFNLQEAIKLKSNYREAYLALGLFFFDQKKYPEAVTQIHQVLKLVPNDSEALSALNDWGKQGIATDSANQ